ncbi:amidohydrolase [Streptomyces acidiscabies]|uniref:Amidohydrolase n=1 Tax=Streptomyces acidiscabies TaxID=42234 RepID=A0A0L0JSZ3_9ACTN|nr:amidohydrolase [Streptomyces acidiscabies]KND28696.1 amidohydrolase [Streptomyces acidiscabies]
MHRSAPTLVLTGGQVLTVDDGFTVTEGVAVRGGHIVATGSDADMRALAGPGTRIVALGGRTVLPGLNDSHLHGAAYGMTKPPFTLDVGHSAVASIADIADAVRRATHVTRPGEWIVGLGWDPGYLAECLADPRRFPHRRDLDAVAPQHPVCLTDFSSHAVWANSEALRRCGVDADSAHRHGGVVDLDADGTPTGILREAAQRLVQAALPTPTIAQRRRAVQGVIRELHTRGTTSYTEPGLGPGGADTLFGGLSTDNWTAYADLLTAGELHARVSVLLLPAPIGGSAADVRKGLEELRRPHSADPRLLNAIGVKIFADGVPPNRTAWMREPYRDGGHGSLCVHGDTPELQVGELREMIALAHEAGFQLGVHVTGDRAIDTVVDAFLAANTATPRADARHYVIHGDFIGAERSAYQWPVRSALDAGVPVCASSDAPITEPDWRQGVAAMLLRESRASGRPSGPGQRVTLAQALRAYTATPAWQDFAEDWKGTVEAGKVADLCVLDRPLLGLDPHDIPDVQVDLTVFDGRVVHER